MMNSFKKVILPCTIAGLLVLGGCGAAGSTASSLEQQVSSVLESQESTAVAVQAVTTAAETSAAEETEAAETTTASTDTEESEYFSNRDLAGTYDESEAETIVLNGESVTISEEGVYIISGTISDGQIIVDVEDTEKVQLVLDGVDITSSDSAAIYVKSADKVFITLAEGSTNVLKTSGTFAASEDNIDGVIFAKDDLTINGSGTLEISTSNGHGIVAKDELTITGGTINVESSGSAISVNDVLAIVNADITVDSDKDAIECENDDTTLGIIYIESGTFTLYSGDDGISATGDIIIEDGDFYIDAVDDAIHSDGCITINGGTFDIDAGDDAIHAEGMLTVNGGEINIVAAEGLEATYVLINDGTIDIQASDDGINAANKSSAYETAVEINGGYITINMGQGDTDGIDSNGNVYINGGTIDITGQSSIDYDGNAVYNGGTIIVNGQQIDSIPNQMMGGGMGGPGGDFGGGMGGWH